MDIEKAAEFLPSLRPDTNHPIASTLATSGTDGQPINKAFAEYLPNSGDGLSRNLSLPDVMTKSDDPKMMNGLTLEKAGDDAYCRVDSHPVESTGVGTRTPDLRIMRPQAVSPNGLSAHDLRQTAPSVAHYLPTDTCKIDPELAALVTAWPNLPDAIRVSILMLVRAAKG